jgi:protein Mpv17
MLQRIAAPFRTVASGYARINAKSPFVVSCTSAGIVAGIGDGIMQKIEGNDLDPLRVGRMMIYRSMFFAPTYALWLRGLEKVVPATVVSVRTVVTKVAMEQVIWGPPALGMFYVVMSCLEGNSPQHGYERAKALIVETIKMSVCFWTPMQLVTFSVVPMQYRVLWVSILQVGWNAWLSAMNQNEKVRQLKLSVEEASEVLDEQGDVMTQKDC